MAARLRAHGRAWSWKGRIAALILSVVLSANWGWQTWQRRTQALTEAETLVVSLTRAAEYQIAGSLRSVVALLDEAADRIDPRTWPQPGLHAWFHARLAGFPEVRAMRVIGADGRPLGEAVVSDGRQPMVLNGVSSFAQRDYFQRLSREPATTLVIGAPVVAGDQASIPIARTIRDHQGRFLGVVVAGVDAGALRNILNAVAVENDGGSALLRRDALFLARVPGHDTWIGKAVPDSPVFRDLLPKAETGIGHFVGLADGHDKIVAYRSFADYPLVVLVGVTHATALAPWRAQMLKEGAANAVMVVALLVLATLYDRRAQASRALLQALADSHHDLERQVAERTAHLAASNAELAQFTFIASHDLQEPLRSVSGFLQLLERRYAAQLDDEAREYIAFAVSGAKRMSTLLHDVLAYAQIGRPGDQPVRCDAQAVAREVAAALADSVRESGAELRIGALPAVSLVPGQLYCLFQNLLGNALKYHGGGQTPVVALSAEDMGNGWVRMAVTDNGIGIDPQYHERIFKIFQRLHRREEYEGTGIGLAMCKKIVESAGGRIWVESAPGRGSTFRFTLPLAG